MHCYILVTCYRRAAFVCNYSVSVGLSPHLHFISKAFPTWSRCTENSVAPCHCWLASSCHFKALSSGFALEQRVPVMTARPPDRVLREEVVTAAQGWLAGCASSAGVCWTSEEKKTPQQRKRHQVSVTCSPWLKRAFAVGSESVRAT